MSRTAASADDLSTGCALIGVDWGTSSLRVYGMTADGDVVRRRESAEGILVVDDFGAHLDTVLAEWPHIGHEVPVVLSGMITSRQGWVETPYLDCPAPVSALAAGLYRLRSPGGRTLHFITGLACRRADGTPDVMRGEETETLGAALANGLLVMPGTHSKWVHLVGGAVREFTTFMTGEVYAALREHSILGRLMTGDAFDEDGFTRGVGEGLDAGSGLLPRLFGVRTRGLFGDLPEAALADYLSGLLIGTEFREGLAAAGGDARRVTLLGRGDLVERYARAAALAGVEAVAGPAEPAARGHHRIAREAGLIA